MNQKKISRSVLIWLYTGAFLVAVMVVVGGITRLTQSGLSMVTWDPIMEAIPPMNEGEWQEAFEAYKKFPEYQLVNNQMNLEEFKDIFFWEWLHRNIGRLIGLVFIIPFIYFLVKKKLDPPRIRQSIILLLLGSLQGALGWIMVESGLRDIPHVSHYKLAMHLIVAFTTYCYIFWVIFGIRFPKKSSRNVGNLARVIRVFFVFLFIQIVYGAFVAGLKAGLSYPTWPKMGTKWIADDVKYSFSETGLSSLVENGSSIQFIHRWMAVIVLILAVYLFIRKRKFSLNLQQNNGITYLLLAVLLQFTLGVFTLVYQVPISLGILHQFGALFILTAGTYLLYQFRR